MQIMITTNDCAVFVQRSFIKGEGEGPKKIDLQGNSCETNEQIKEQFLYMHRFLERGEGMEKASS